MANRTQLAQIQCKCIGLSAPSKCAWICPGSYYGAVGSYEYAYCYGYILDPAIGWSNGPVSKCDPDKCSARECICTNSMCRLQDTFGNHW